MKKSIQHANDVIEKTYLCVVCREQHVKTFVKKKKPPLTETEYCYTCRSDRFFRLKEN